MQPLHDVQRGVTVVAPRGVPVREAMLNRRLSDTIRLLSARGFLCAPSRSQTCCDVKAMSIFIGTPIESRELPQSVSFRSVDELGDSSGVL